MFSRWNPRGGELFYIVGNRLTAIDVKTSTTVVVGAPRMLFDATQLGTVLIPSRDPLQRRYDVMPDGQRFVVLMGAEFGTSEITVIENWAATVR